MNLEAKIRDFEFPQTFVSFDITDHSLKYLNRRLRELSNDSIRPLTEIEDKRLTRGRVKIESREYISDSGNPDDFYLAIRRNNSLHPVKLITLIRLLMLVNLQQLPERILNQGFCLAWAGDNKWYKVSLQEGNKFIEEYRDFLHISPDTPIIIESDPI